MDDKSTSTIWFYASIAAYTTSTEEVRAGALHRVDVHKDAKWAQFLSDTVNT